MSQTQTVLHHLQKNTHITPLTAIGVYGIFRLGARIHDLRREGYEIETEINRDARGRPYARYSLRHTLPTQRAA